MFSFAENSDQTVPESIDQSIKKELHKQQIENCYGKYPDTKKSINELHEDKKHTDREEGSCGK